ncbi:MAG: hypothetical protein ACKVU4_11525 [Phycisphaerales bacterium]
MRHRAHRGRARGFVRIEAAAILVVACVLLAVIAMLGAESRRQARLGDDIANLQQIGAWTGSYAADNADLYWSFGWKKGHTQTQWPDLVAQAQAGDREAQSAQAVDILRRQAGRLDITPIVWFANARHSHLALLDYLATLFPEAAFVSTMDKDLTKWARDPFGFDKGLYQPAPSPPIGPGTNSGKRWPYAASFQVPTVFFDRSPIGFRASQSGLNHSTYSIPSQVQLGGQTRSAVAFPSAKVHVHDTHGRHFGTRVPYCIADESRLPLLFADESVVVRSAVEANPGWNPNSLTSVSPTNMIYAPDVWEPPVPGGAPSQPVIGRFRWTRGTATEHGIAGRDFDGPETCSGQPGCLP